MTNAPSLTAPEPDLWTSDQLNCVAVQLLMIVGLFFGLFLFKHDYLSMLWTHPLGIRMLVGAVVLTVFNFGLYLLLCAMLNRCFPPGNKDMERKRNLLSCLLMTIHLIVFFFPVVFVLLIGPAAVQISENLMGN
jgi:hypothetical protein